MMRLAIGSLLFVVIACDGDRRVVRPGAGELELVAESTAGWGCVMPPFFVGRAPDDDAKGSACVTAASTYLLTSVEGIPDPAEGPPGHYRLVGRWSGAQSTWSAWARARGRAIPEGAPADAVRFPVFVVRDWCIEGVPSYVPAADPSRARICR
jgi:hypothetical protein